MTDVAPFGHIKLSRKAFDDEQGDQFWLEPREFSRFEAWVDVLQLACFSAYRHQTGFGVVDLDRGEFVASIRWLGSRWKWSIKRVRNFLSTSLKWDRVRAQRETPAGTVYLIVNYDTYQLGGHTEGTVKGIAGAQPGHSKGTREKQVKASKAITTTGDAMFDEAWALYPRRPGNNRAAAYTQWLKRVRDGIDPVEMLTGTHRYRAHVDSLEQQDRKFVKMAKTFYGPDCHFRDDWTVEEFDQEIVDKDGCLTAYGERITRPANV